MPFSSSLIALARYMAGEFDNREQAIAEPTWYVHLRLWQRPVNLFAEDSLTLFAEQANALQLDRPYRQRLLRLTQTDDPQTPLRVQYYAFKEPSAFSGAGANPELLTALIPEQIEQLPGCVLNVTEPQPSVFAAFPPNGARCYFTYNGEIRQVSLGFEVRSGKFISYDKGIDAESGKAIWGAVMGPYRFTKRREYSVEF